MIDIARFRIPAGIVEKALVLKSPKVSEKMARAWERRKAERPNAAAWRSRGPDTVWRDCACCGQAL